MCVPNACRSVCGCTSAASPRLSAICFTILPTLRVVNGSCPAPADSSAAAHHARASPYPPPPTFPCAPADSPNRCRRLIAKRHQSLFPAFTKHPNRIIAPQNARPDPTPQLRVTNPRPIQQLKDHTIPRRPRSASLSLGCGCPTLDARLVRGRVGAFLRATPPEPDNEFNTRFNSSIPGTLGRCFGSFGVLTSTAGFDSHIPTPRQPLEPAPHRRQRPRHTRLRQPRSNNTPRYARICVCSTLRISPPSPSVSAEILRKPTHLTPIRPQRMLTRPPLLAQHRKKAFRQTRDRSTTSLL